MLTVDSAVSQASSTARGYASDAFRNLCEILNIDENDRERLTKLAPFASVIAAMITASAADYDCSMRSGLIEHVSPQLDCLLTDNRD
jgi:hypothetical protein